MTMYLYVHIQLLLCFNEQITIFAIEIMTYPIITILSRIAVALIVAFCVGVFSVSLWFLFQPQLNMYTESEQETY